MPPLLPFAKYSGCGNDFILVDNREQCWPLDVFPARDRLEISHICHRRHGVGADGLIFLENTPDSTFRMRIFNADGGEAEMCGNGVRCLAGFLRDSGVVGDFFTIQTMHNIVQATIHGSNAGKHLVSVTMPPPIDIAYFTRLAVSQTIHEMHCLNTGVPHAILFVEDLECPTLMQLAPHIRFHAHFPEGTNVNFVSLSEDGNALYIRTYERGVEQETLACGTGAVAAAIAASHVYGISSPVRVHTRSSEILYIDTSLQKPSMKGPAVRIYQGSLQRILHFN